MLLFAGTGPSFQEVPGAAGGGLLTGAPVPWLESRVSNPREFDAVSMTEVPTTKLAVPVWYRTLDCSIYSLNVTAPSRPSAIAFRCA